jgi:hypothetical protein
MPDHVRKQIRDRVVTNLTGLTTTGANVFPSRVYDLAETEIPGLSIYITTEEANEENFAAVGSDISEERHATVTIEARAKETDADTLDDTLDLISQEVETAMAADRDINGLALASFYAGMEDEMTGDGDDPVGVRTILYTVVYSILSSTPDIPR